MSDIGKKIAQRRKELNMTQEELAIKMGYKSKSTINKIELGINDIVQSKVVQFAKVLDCSTAYLMGWEEEEQITTNQTLTNKNKKTTDEQTLTDGEKALLSLFREVPVEMQDVVLEMIQVSLKNRK